MVADREVTAKGCASRRSPGPRTGLGKARSNQNALRHGLAIAVASVPAWQPEIENLALAIAGDHKIDPVRWHFALIAAEAQVELRRVREVRRSMLVAALGETAFETDSGVDHDRPESTMDRLSKSLPDLFRLERYERRAMSRRNRALAVL